MVSKYYPDGRVVPGTTWEPKPPELPVYTILNEDDGLEALDKPWKPPVFLGWGEADGDLE